MAWALGAAGFVLAQIVALCMIPLGLPGTWLQVAIACALWWINPGTTGHLLALAIALAVLGEVTDVLSGRWGARRYGGSARAAWGAFLGGFAGLFVGAPIPVIGSLVMSFVGTFAGAVVGEVWGSGERAALLRIGWGALVGRVLGVVVKMGLAFVITVLSTIALLRAGGG